jgi:hypothetical protein
MKRNIYILTSLIFYLQSFGQEAENNFPCSLPDGFYSLRGYADSLIRHSEIISCVFSSDNARARSEKLFFDLFPSKFDCFNYLYGNAKHSVLNSYSLDHVEILFSLNIIGPTQHVAKQIELSLQGSWEADAINYLRYNMKNQVSNILHQFVKQLSAYPDKEILSFWYFLFDGPHPENYKDDYNKLYNRCKALDSEIAELMRQAYEKLLSEDKCQGH